MVCDKSFLGPRAVRRANRPVSMRTTLRGQWPQRSATSSRSFAGWCGDAGFARELTTECVGVVRAPVLVGVKLPRVRACPFRSRPSRPWFPRRSPSVATVWLAAPPSRGAWEIAGGSIRQTRRRAPGLAGEGCCWGKGPSRDYVRSALRRGTPRWACGKLRC